MSQHTLLYNARLQFTCLLPLFLLLPLLLDAKEYIKYDNDYVAEYDNVDDDMSSWELQEEHVTGENIGSKSDPLPHKRNGMVLDLYSLNPLAIPWFLNPEDPTVGADPAPWDGTVTEESESQRQEEAVLSTAEDYEVLQDNWIEQAVS
ncbi:uncharacterized protein LOC143037930 [Oratosquilla oratoria]|uniref:uncharacterized protein LOC143037930 n=1 Tax=Oratosquilla oratoria TaxID=337810 RepID=UPI003F75FC30